MRGNVPLANPGLDAAQQRAEILEAVAQVLDGGAFILGPRVAQFEEAIADQLGLSGAVGVASGTDAIELALRALRIGPGAEVITVSHTAGPAVAAIVTTGATPVLIDVDADTYCLDPAKLEAAISDKTKAILVVHLYGHPADMDAITAIAKAHRLFVLEDCAQAHGARFQNRVVGTLGDAGCFSFYPTKNLGALGDAGLVTAQDFDLVERVRRLRTYGWSDQQYAQVPGGRCSRLDELQAAILLVKLKFFEASRTRRRSLARAYSDALAGLPLVLPVERGGCDHAFHRYVVRSACRDQLASHLTQRGISVAVHYPYPVHAQPGFCEKITVAGDLTVTDSISREILSLPLFTGMSDDQQAYVIDEIASFFRGRHG